MRDIKLKRNEVGRMSYCHLVKSLIEWSRNVGIDSIYGLPGDLKISESNEKILEAELLKRHPKKEREKHDANTLATSFIEAVKMKPSEERAFRRACALQTFIDNKKKERGLAITLAKTDN